MKYKRIELDANIIQDFKNLFKTTKKEGITDDDLYYLLDNLLWDYEGELALNLFVAMFDDIKTRHKVCNSNKELYAHLKDENILTKEILEDASVQTAITLYDYYTLFDLLNLNADICYLGDDKFLYVEWI